MALVKLGDKTAGQAPKYNETILIFEEIFNDFVISITVIIESYKLENDDFMREVEDALKVRRLDSPDDATQDEIMKNFIEEVVIFLNELAATFPSVNMDLDVIFEEFISVTRALIKVTRENNPALATTAPTTSAPTTSVPTTSTPTVTSSIRSPHPTYDYSA